MKVAALLESRRPVISFEFFPPKTDEGLKNLMETIAALRPLNPSYVSMTYGAGGSTRTKTVDLVSRIKHEIGLEAVAHLTCVGHNRDELAGILAELEKRGIENVLALRGDTPQGLASFPIVAGGFRYASELVAFIRSRFGFCIGVAGYPEKHVEAPSLEEDLGHLKEKVGSGADFVITQLFFDNRDYFAFADRVAKMGVAAPVVPGIMPVTDFDQVKRFTSLCGAKIPDDLRRRLESADGDKAAVARVGIEHATAQCEELLAKGAPGLHFYTLNRSHATVEIFRRLQDRGAVGG